MASTTSNLLNIKQAAEFLGVNPGTIRRWALANTLKGIKVGSRGDWRFTKINLLKMTRTNREEISKTFIDNPSFFEQVSNTVPGMVVVYNIKTGKYIYVNKAIKKMLGYTSDAFLKGGLQFITTLVHPADLPRIMQQNKKTLVRANSKRFAKKMDESIIPFEYRMRHKNGKWIWVKTDGSVFGRDKYGKVEYVLNISIDITNRKESEEQLKKIHKEVEKKVLERTKELALSEQQFRTLTTHAPVGIFLADQKGNCLFVNELWCKLAGMSYKNAMGKGWINALHPDDKERIFKEWYTATHENKPFSTEYRFKTAKGKTNWLHGSAVSLSDNDGKTTGYIGTIVDITERKQMQKKIQVSEMRYRTMIEQSPLSTQILSPDGKTLQVNKAWEKLWGATLEQLRDYNMLKDKQLVELGIMPYIKKGFKGEPTHIPAVRYEPNKAVPDATKILYRWVSAIIYPVKDEHGIIQEIVLIHEDITEQKDATEKILQSEKQLQAVMDESPAVIFVKGLDGRYLLINRQYETLFKITRDKIKGKTDYDLFPKETADQVTENDKKVLRTKTPIEAEEVVPHDDGLHTYISVKFPLYESSGKPYAVCGIATDITERKRIQDNLAYLSEAGSLLSSSLDYKTTLSNIAKLAVPKIADWCAIDILNGKGEIEQVAVAHKDSKKVKWAQKLRKRYPPDMNAKTGLPNILRTGKSELYPHIGDSMLVAAARDKAHYTLLKNLGFTSAMTVPLFSQKTPIGAISFVTTETKRNYNKADLAMAEELASRASLALENSGLYKASQEAISLRDDFISVASHELKTPITSVKMFAQVLQKHSEQIGDTQAVSYLSKMDRQLNKLTELIYDLLNVSKIQAGKMEFQEELFYFDKAVRDVVEVLAQTAIKHTIKVQGKTGKNVRGDEERIGQVINNLISNAIKYSPKADKVLVHLRSDKNNVYLAVQDFGIGMEKAHLGRIFERFYRVYDTTDKTFPGLGIGLYISSEIVRRHGGKLWVESNIGKGSTFHFSLPLNGKKSLKIYE